LLHQFASVSIEPRSNHRIFVYQPAQVWLATAVALVVLVSAGYALFQRGVRHAGLELDRLAQQGGTLQRQLDEERSANAGLRQQLAILERSSEIDRRAALEVRNEFAALQEKVQSLRKDLAFYRGIVSPADNKAGLNIQRFELQPGSLAGRYNYKLMLTQVKRNDRYVQGVIEIDVEGLQDGSSKVLSFAGLRVDKGDALTFKFRYFQDFEGQIELPPKFEPQRLRIRVKTTGKNQPPDMEKTMEWPA
jgi:hypothetical protein